MKKQTINPWQWQDQLGYSQAVEVTNYQGTLYVAGQAAMTGDGRPVAGSMPEQIELVIKNIEKVLHQASYEVSNIVRLNVFTVSVPEFFAAYGTMLQWLQQHKLAPASTLVEVSALAFPELKVEVEVTAVK